MSNQNKGRFSRFIMGKGFYVALAVCLAGAGTAAWVTVNNTINKIETPFTEAPQVQENQTLMGETPPLSPSGSEESFSNPINNKPVEPVEQKKEDVKKPSEPPVEEPSSSANASSSSEDQSVSAEPSEPPAQSEASQTSAYVLPMQTEVMAPFSGDTLVENITLKDWRTHNGIDLKASAGDPVKSFSDGVVTSVSYDPLWGTVLEVTSGSITATYSGLNESVPVKINSSVKAGDLLGTVGEIPCESALEPHLHFSVTKDGQYIDPLSLLPQQ